MIRDSDGKFLDTTPFREAALHFMEYGNYCEDPWGSDRWFEYWKEQRRRCIEGYEVEGVRITGDHYFYLNFCPIQKVEDSTSKKSKKVKGFPDFWDGDYSYFWAREIARNGIGKEEYGKVDPIVKISEEHLDGGYNFICGKSRRKGYSFKAAAIAAKNFFCIPNSLTILGASDTKYLYPSGLFKMVMDYINFINMNTAWAMPSDVINKPAQGHIKASYIEYRDGIKIEAGFKSEIQCLSFGDNPDASRGKDIYDLFFEESGAFGVPGLLKASYRASEDCVKAGEVKTGLITIFGCVCKDTEVYDAAGVPKRIQDISPNTGIMGYASKGVVSEPIRYLQPPMQKECVRIETASGGSIECSTDHPLLTRVKKSKATFVRAEDLREGDHLLRIRQLPKFGDKVMWHPRLVGLLIGDGYYGRKGCSPQLSVSSRNIMSYLEAIGISYSVYVPKSCEAPFHRYVTIHATQKEMDYLGISGQSKKAKRLPTNIHEYRMADISEFLGGLFDSDGYVYAKKGKKGGKITFSTTIPEMAEGVKDLLFRFGVRSTIFQRESAPRTLKSKVNGKDYEIQGGSISYSVEIVDKFSLRNFRKHIKLVAEKKQEALFLMDLSDSQNDRVATFKYEHTIEDGSYFIENDKLEYLEPVVVKSITALGKKDVYNIGTEITHTYITNGFVSHNTSGSMDKGTADYADMFSRPEAFGLLPCYNIWEEGRSSELCGFFHPAHLNMEGYYDSNGNSDIEGAKEAVEKSRKKLLDGGAVTSEMTLRMQERPLTPSEAFTPSAKNIFPVAELKRQLDKVKMGLKGIVKGVPVDLVMSGGEVVSKPILSGANPIVSYYDMPSDQRGCVVVYEQPAYDAPKGLYKIGYDPVRQDSGTSLASIVVYKGVHTVSTRKNLIVAEYIGRLDSAEDIDRVAEKLAIYYNTTIMHENEVTGVKNYFRRIKRLDLLAVQPDAVISSNVKASKVARVYGCHMNDKLKDAGERYIKDWLIEVVDYDEHGSPVRNIDNIYSQRLLEELMSYNRKGNFDMVSALIMCMIQVQEEALGKTYGEKKTHATAEKLLSMISKMNRNDY